MDLDNVYSVDHRRNCDQVVEEIIVDDSLLSFHCRFFVVQGMFILRKVLAIYLKSTKISGGKFQNDILGEIT